MDTSQVYVDMCRQAKEIQEIMKASPQDGDFFVAISPGSNVAGHYIWSHTDFTTRTAQGNRDCYWLPRLDQLIAMITDEPSPLKLAFKFTEFLNTPLPPDDAVVMLSHSMGQLWLMFVMHHKYHKRWDAEKKDWVQEVAP